MQKLQEQIPVKTKSRAIIAVIYELSGLVVIGQARVVIGTKIQHLPLARIELDSYRGGLSRS